jgi:lysophospholipid acyltransferase (LPLAT)-like uncharacterized protein
MKRILRLSATQWALAWLIGTYLTVMLRTIRWDLYGGDHLAPFAEGQIVIAAFWHERLALMPTLWMKARESGRRGGRSQRRQNVRFGVDQGWQ